ncbi:MAG: hypothetical protein QOG72_2476 [Sphingomonadales bacterium]|jgi:hypothetical protein|nr:hypothetical protein [Sphingomonadales bacterium]
MADSKSDWTKLITRAAVVLGIGAVLAAVVAAIGSGTGLWSFRVGLTSLRYLFFAAAAGAVLGLIGLFMARRRGKLMLANLVAVVVALGFVLYLGNLVRIAKSVPAIHDVATNLDDVPQFTRLRVRADNLENIPDEGRPELKALPPEARWKAVHRAHYGDLRTVRLATPPAETVRRVASLAHDRGWQTALVDDRTGTVEATATSLFFRFKDDVVVRVRPAPGGGSLVDMRSISRVGGSDVGMNAKRVRAFLADLQR